MNKMKYTYENKIIMRNKTIFHCINSPYPFIQAGF